MSSDSVTGNNHFTCNYFYALYLQQTQVDSLEILDVVF